MTPQPHFLHRLNRETNSGADDSLLSECLDVIESLEHALSHVVDCDNTAPTIDDPTPTKLCRHCRWMVEGTLKDLRK